MERFYVLEPQTQLRKSGSSLLVMRGRETVAEVPLEGLEQLTLMGYTSLTGAVLDSLIQNRVETVLVTPRGRFRARLLVDEHKHVQRRQAQYLRLADPATVLESARAIVGGKLRNGARFLALRGADYGDPELGVAAARIKGLARMLDTVPDLDAVRGVEGQGAHLYFRAFPRLIRVEGFPFGGRSRRPPLDPINALLSFVYTLLTLEVLTAVKIVGLDPYLGSLHDVDYGRPSLACDLVEEWRTFLGDRLVLSLVNRRIIGPEDFVIRGVESTDAVDEEDLKSRRPVEMKPKTCRALIQSYEKWMAGRAPVPGRGRKTDFRGLIRHQVRHYLSFLQGEADRYEPYRWSQSF
ncbi:MAG: CRISPR-associated endonuclease Cas1 [Syntrophobacteraceae bacterium]|jgi:CRISPR-associated protein Cas1|nr:CRISPR-associated endonuclease Cas1 [Syntrophobacteraceae bacterium]